MRVFVATALIVFAGSFPTQVTKKQREKPEGGGASAKTIRVKVYQTDRGGADITLDPDKVLVETWPGKTQTLQTLLKKLDSVELCSLEVALRDADTRKPIEGKFSFSGFGFSRPATHPPSYFTGFPRSTRYSAPGNGKIRFTWVRAGAEPISVTFGAAGYEDQRATFDEKDILEAHVSIFLKKRTQD